MKIRVAPNEPLLKPYHKLIIRILFVVGILATAGLTLHYLIPMYVYYYVPEELTPYTIQSPRHLDDTLRIAFIGDSWADYHTSLRGDTMIANSASKIFDQPVKSSTRGTKGALSKEVYFYMYSNRTVEHAYEKDRCTQPLIEERPNYCVIFAGINDVTFRRPTSFYAENMLYIVRLLLHNSIKPVVMEIPIVDFDYPIPRFRFKERLFYRTRSTLMGTSNNKGEDYHKALNDMLSNTHLKDSVLYIAAKQWNPKGCLDTTMFLDDCLHLNLNGYHKLDSCIATEIIRDYTKKRNGKTSTSDNN